MPEEGSTRGVTDAEFRFGLDTVEEKAVKFHSHWYICGSLAAKPQRDDYVRTALRDMKVLKNVGPLGAYQTLWAEMIRSGLRGLKAQSAVYRVSEKEFNALARHLKRGHFHPHRGKL